jgi:SAM-dependent methyltransferase
VPVVSALLNDAPFPDESFDAITMWDVLEHVHQPLVVIDAAARLLRPGGVLVVNHPNTASIDRRLFGRFWMGYELPRHLYLYPGDLLRRLMAERGLVEIERRCLYGSHAASSTSLALMTQDRYGSGRLTQAIRAVLFSKLLRVLLLPYFKLIDDRRMGSNITAVFQRIA